MTICMATKIQMATPLRKGSEKEISHEIARDFFVHKRKNAPR
jgi:hypothetical protein